MSWPTSPPEPLDRPSASGYPRTPAAAKEKTPAEAQGLPTSREPTRPERGGLLPPMLLRSHQTEPKSTRNYRIWRVTDPAHCRCIQANETLLSNLNILYLLKFHSI